MNKHLFNRLGWITASLAVATGAWAPALAMGNSSYSGSATSNQSVADGSQNTTTTSTGQSTDTHGSGSSNKPTDPGAQGATRLAAAQLKSCQKREHAIDNILKRIADRGQKQLDLFTTIATRTETFYTTKGKTLSNYDTLVANVATAKSAAQTAVDAVTADSVSFKCDGSDPKGAASSFQTALKSEISALQDYRTAVKNLIVGVKSVQGTTSSTDSQTSPSSASSTQSTTSPSNTTTNPTTGGN